MLTESACSHYDTNTKVMPPLRTAEDCAALLEALIDGTIDCVATDHAPHSPVEKHVEFECAAPGMLGLETALPILLGLHKDTGGKLTLQRLIAALTDGPARAFKLAGGTLAPGAAADLVAIDPDRENVVSVEGLSSRSKNTPFLGRTLHGKAVLTIVGGRVVHDVDGRMT